MAISDLHTLLAALYHCRMAMAMAKFAAERVLTAPSYSFPRVS
jgi:hypothetical protein